MLWRNIPSYRLLPYTPGLHSELLKSLLTLWVLEETRQTWTMFSELKALVDSEKFGVIVFQYRAKNDNSEFSLQIMIPYVKVKFRVIVFMYGQK